MTNDEGSDETRIVVAGIDGAGHGFLIADISGRQKPVTMLRDNENEPGKAQIVLTATYFGPNAPINGRCSVQREDT